MVRTLSLPAMIHGHNFCRQISVHKFPSTDNFQRHLQPHDTHSLLLLRAHEWAKKHERKIEHWAIPYPGKLDTRLKCLGAKCWTLFFIKWVQVQSGLLARREWSSFFVHTCFDRQSSNVQEFLEKLTYLFSFKPTRHLLLTIAWTYFSTCQCTPEFTVAKPRDFFFWNDFY